MVEKVLFLCEITEMEILIDLYILWSFEYENHTFNDWSICLLSAQLKNKLQQKLQILYSTIVLLILFETYYEDQTNCLCMGAHRKSNTLQSTDGISCWCFLTDLDCTK